jgi:hypothetical protein
MLSLFFNRPWGTRSEAESDRRRLAEAEAADAVAAYAADERELESVSAEAKRLRVEQRQQVGGAARLQLPRLLTGTADWLPRNNRPRMTPCLSVRYPRYNRIWRHALRSMASGRC